MRIALIDLEEDSKGCNNKDQTGTYGSVMDAGGLAGFLFHLFKRRLVRLPILSFGYLAAILRRQGHEVTVHSSYPKKADLAVIATSIIGYRQEIDFAREVKKRLKCLIGFTGAFAKAKPELFLEAGDFVIDGEPERWAMEIDTHLQERGVIRSEWIDDLESLPFPDWRGFPVQNYGYSPLLRKRPFLTMQSSRGCPFACPYCQYLPIQGIRWRKRSPENVVEEIEYLRKDFRIKSLLFRDIVFSMNMERTRDLAELIIRRGLRIDWGCETRADRLDCDLLSLLGRSGMRFVNLGIESPDDKILEEHGRKALDRENLERIIEHAERIGIMVNAFYLLGFPSETEDGIRRTIEYACKLNTSLAQFCVVTPYPGTPFHEDIKREDRLFSADWSEYTTYNPVIKLDHLSREDILRLKKYAYKRYFLRPGWLLKKGLSFLK